MKTPLSETEQNNLRTRGVLGSKEIAYREGGHTYAEDALNGQKRIINLTGIVSEGKNLLLG